MKIKNIIKQELESELNAEINLEDDSIIILDDVTMETDDYLVFFYNSKKFIETNDFSYALAGNAPIIVNKRTNERHLTGTAYPVEHYIDEYERMILH